MEYSFEAWKGERTIHRVCKHLLDNADLDIEISSFPLALTLKFFVVGSDIKVVFKCAEIESLHIRKESDDEAMFVVLETRVQESKSELGEGTLWSISTLPEAEIECLCARFEWSLEQMSDSERTRK